MTPIDARRAPEIRGQRQNGSRRGGGTVAMSDTSPQTPQPARSPRLSRRRVAANFLSIAGTNVLEPVVTVLISVYVRRALGPEAIGQVSRWRSWRT